MVLHGKGGCRLGVEVIDRVRAHHPLPGAGAEPRRGRGRENPVSHPHLKMSTVVGCRGRA